jgi:hypothetical protein
MVLRHHLLKLFEKTSKRMLSVITSELFLYHRFK